MCNPVPLGIGQAEFDKGELMTKMISIIAAIGKKRELGLNGKLLWHIKEDLQNFKRITMNHHVIVGRKTFESIGKLPGRFPIVLTTQENYKGNCIVASNLTEAINLTGDDTEIFIIGGGEIYAQALYLTDTIYLTEVDYEGEADTFFPDISTYSWFLKNKVEYEGWRFIHLVRIGS